MLNILQTGRYCLNIIKEIDMTQTQMAKLLDVSDRTLRSWKERQGKLYALLERLDLNQAEELLSQKDEQHILRLIDNQHYFQESRAFERELFKFLVSKFDVSVLKKMAKNTTLSKEARARSAYLYTFLTKKPIKLSFTLRQRVGLYHERKKESGDGLAGHYGLLSGVDANRFNQFKTKGLN